MNERLEVGCPEVEVAWYPLYGLSA